ncbi:hypothetical protein [Roseovarius sp. EL26]|uniref:hypothetical protein n=1 Tax=Roseovarius sp. EL26 TaxID=2126672 RepID=UPI000EA3820E|nr:hypothetical protein [Roseovarius sp. EL26]
MLNTPISAPLPPDFGIMLSAMRIVETSPDKLILEHRPKFMAGLIWFLGLTCIYMGLSGQTDGIVETMLVTFLGVGAFGLAHHFFPFQRLTFDRAAGLFTREVARITGPFLTELPLAEVERITVQAQWSDSSRLERLIMIHRGKKLPLEYGYFSAPRTGLAKDINTWLSNS